MHVSKHLHIHTYPQMAAIYNPLNPALVMAPTNQYVRTVDCLACSLRPDGTAKDPSGEANGYYIVNQAEHDAKAKHQRKMAAGRHLIPQAVAAARGPGEHYTAVHMMIKTTHRCRVCSLNPESDPVRRYHEMLPSSVMPHLASADHDRRVRDQRYERFVARGVAWVPPALL